MAKPGDGCDNCGLSHNGLCQDAIRAYYERRIERLRDLISEAAPLYWASGGTMAAIEDAAAWEKKATQTLKGE